MNDVTMTDDKELVRHVAYAMWVVETPDLPPKGSEARKAEWRAVKKDKLRTARKLMTKLAKQGVSVAKS